MIQILLDECLHVDLKYRFQEQNSNFEVSTFNQKGWNGIKNGKLLALSEQEFEVFITSDQNIPYQQNLSQFSIAVVVLKAKSNRYEDLIKFVEPASEIIESTKQGKFYEVILSVE